MYWCIIGHFFLKSSQLYVCVIPPTDIDLLQVGEIVPESSPQGKAPTHQSHFC